MAAVFYRLYPRNFCSGFWLFFLSFVLFRQTNATSMLCFDFSIRYAVMRIIQLSSSLSLAHGPMRPRDATNIVCARLALQWVRIVLRPQATLDVSVLYQWTRECTREFIGVKIFCVASSATQFVEHAQRKHGTRNRWHRMSDRQRRPHLNVLSIRDITFRPKRSVR